MDPQLQRRLTHIIKSVTGDDDWVGIIAGPERSGKSVLGMQIGMFLSEGKLQLMHVVLTVKDFILAIKNAQKGDAIIFDEAARGGSTKARFTKISLIMHNLMMEMGQKNLKIILCTPSVFELTPYLKFERSKVLFYTYKYNGKKGFWKAWGGQRKNELLGKAMKTRSIRCGIKADCGGRFPNFYIVDEQAYRAKKASYFRMHLDKDVRDIEAGENKSNGPPPRSIPDTESADEKVLKELLGISTKQEPEQKPDWN